MPAIPTISRKLLLLPPLAKAADSISVSLGGQFLVFRVKRISNWEPVRFPQTLRFSGCNRLHRNNYPGITVFTIELCFSDPD